MQWRHIGAFDPWVWIPGFCEQATWCISDATCIIDFGGLALAHRAA
jgi:hypothetical protein